jgi:hypothetical protein
MRIVGILLLIGAASALGQDITGLGERVRVERWSQTSPAIVNVSVNSWTTIQVPEQIESLEGGSFTQKPEEETGEFWIVPGDKWFSIKSLKAGAKQNLGVVISGRVYEILVQTVESNDFSVLLEFAK